MSSSRWRARAPRRRRPPELVHLEPVEHAALDRLDQVARLEPRVLERVAADEGRALEHDVVELARASASFAPTAQTSAPGAQPLAAQHRVARGRDRDDDVLRRPPRGGSRPARRRRARRTSRAAPGRGSRRRPARSPAAPRGCTRPASRPASPQPITPRLDAPGRARCRAATPLAAPVRSWPSRSASITRDELGRVGAEEADHEARARRGSPRTSSRPRSRARGRPRPSPRASPSWRAGRAGYDAAPVVEATSTAASASPESSASTSPRR